MRARVLLLLTFCLFSPRLPDALAPSAKTLTMPMSPVRFTCVPPHNSTDQPSVLAPGAEPIDTTRTSSPYFSPNSAIAPAEIASSGLISRVTTSSLSRISAFTWASISAISSAESGFGWEKSNRRRSSATSEPFCVT